MTAGHALFCRCGRWASGRRREPAAACALAGSGSADPPDGGSGSNGPGNLGHLVHHLEQTSELISRGIGADLDRIVDARGLPGCGIEPASRGHADPCQSDSQRRGLPVDIIEDAAGCREMEQMPAGEIAFHRDAARSPPVRETDDSTAGGHHCPGTHRHLEAIVDHRLPPPTVTLSGSGPWLSEWIPILIHPIRTDILICRRPTGSSAELTFARHLARAVEDLLTAAPIGLALTDTRGLLLCRPRAS
jgi:hypothetical protein